MLSADFYTGTLAGEDTYNRIYTEVLVDERLKDTTEDLLGDIEVVSQEDIVRLLRRILPPEYLQSQVEGTIENAIYYLNEDTDTLDLYIDLAPPLANAKGVLFEHIDGRIDQLPLEKLVISPRCDPEILENIAGRYELIYRELADGKAPDSIPSFEAIAQPCRRPLFDIVFPRLAEDPELDERVKAGLRARRIEMGDKFEAGDTHGVWKVAARAVATPLIDDAIDDLRERLDDQDRLDIIHQIAEWNTDITEEELRDDIETTRTWVNRTRDFGKVIMLAVVIVIAFIMGMVQFPSLTNGLRWPGLTLLLTGGFYFVLGKVLESQVPDELAELVERGAEEVTAVPPSVTILGGDLLISFGKSITEGFAGPSLTLIVIGAALFAASFLVFIVRPFIPFAK